jgi:hypothetical protein
MREIEMEDAKQCPWCDRWALNGGACAFIFACGLDVDGVFNIGSGCGRSWCWECGKKYCGWYMDPQDGRKSKAAREEHGKCCASSPDFKDHAFCEGGHSNHCASRTFEPAWFCPNTPGVYEYGSYFMTPKDQSPLSSNDNNTTHLVPRIDKNVISDQKKWEHIEKMQAIVSKHTGEIVGVRFVVN